MKDAYNMVTDAARHVTLSLLKNMINLKKNSSV